MVLDPTQEGALIVVKSETLRGWIEQTQIDAGTRPGCHL